MTPPYKRTSGGFTLVELLVVTVIVAVLLMISLPALRTARGSARQAACAAKQHGMGAGLHLYLADNKEYPSATFVTQQGSATNIYTWASLIYPYMFGKPAPTFQNDAGTEFSCPEGIQTKQAYSRIPLSYQANSYANGNRFAVFADTTVRLLPSGQTVGDIPLRIGAVPSPANAIAVADARQSRWAFTYPNSHQMRDAGLFAQPTDGTQPHARKNNFLYADGHVKLAKYSSTWGTGGTASNPRGGWTVQTDD